MLSTNSNYSGRKSFVHDMITSTSRSLSFVKIWLNYTSQVCHKQANNFGNGFSSQLILKECFSYLSHWSANLGCFDICCSSEQKSKLPVYPSHLFIGLNSYGLGSTNNRPSWSCCCIWKYHCIKIYNCYLFCWMHLKLIIIQVFAPECENAF